MTQSGHSLPFCLKAKPILPDDLRRSPAKPHREYAAQGKEKVACAGWAALFECGVHTTVEVSKAGTENLTTAQMHVCPSVPTTPSLDDRSRTNGHR